MSSCSVFRFLVCAAQWLAYCLSLLPVCRVCAVWMLLLRLLLFLTVPGTVGRANSCRLEYGHPGAWGVKTRRTSSGSSGRHLPAENSRAPVPGHSPREASGRSPRMVSGTFSATDCSPPSAEGTAGPWECSSSRTRSPARRE